MLNRTAPILATPVSALGGDGQAWATPSHGAGAKAQRQGVAA